MSAAVTEQSSYDEIADCVQAVLLYTRGSRIDLPEFGVRDMTFQAGVDKEEVERAITQWEPRADVVIEASPVELDTFIARAAIELGADDA
jgi:phage baseplate assembly protein W